MRGLMQDYPLTVDAIFRHVEQHYGDGTIATVVDKGRHAPAYSGFEGIDARGHPLLDVLREARVDHIDVCGLATDYCVRATALDARKYDFQVRVLVNLSAPVNAETGLQALEEMKAAGVQVQAATAP